MKKKSDHQRTVARIRRSLAPLTPCIHVDADGYCMGRNEGALCTKCADYTAKTEEEIRASAVATVEPVKAVPLTDDQAANAIRQQYQVVIRAEAATFRERVRFGGMLLQWERFLGKSHGGYNSDGDGLKGWLEKNCPELGYTAAMGYKTMAERAIKMLGGGAVVTAALLGEHAVEDPSGEVIDVQAEVIKKCDAFFEKADSRRKLEQMWFEFTNGEGAKPKAKKEPGQIVNLSRKEAAKATWSVFMQKATHRSLKDAIPLLGEKETRTCYDDLRDLVELLKNHLKEF